MNRDTVQHEARTLALAAGQQQQSYRANCRIPK